MLRVLEREGGTTLQRKALLVAGHSLGEYSALAAAGAFTIQAAARLLKLRGQAMQKAVHRLVWEQWPLCWAPTWHRLRRSAAKPRPVPETGLTLEIVQPANDNGGGQVVISGHRTAIERAVEIAKTKGVKRALLLPVSAPFHCALMAPVADAMAEALETTPPVAPCVPLVANVSAKRESDPGRIRDLLIQQITATVRWRECVTAMTEMGVDSFIELGAGKVLTGLIKRIAPDASGIAAGTPAEIEAVLKSL